MQRDAMPAAEYASLLRSVPCEVLQNGMGRDGFCPVCGLSAVCHEY